MKELYTVGHSIYEPDDFIALLKKNHINTIVDVRSTPYSKFASQYNRETLKQYLKENQICYIFMGDLLGARYEDKDLLFDSGKVNFKKVQKTTAFQSAISRLDKGITKGYNISLMCSEKEAFDCHRFGLISEYINKHFNDIDIKHIYPDKILSQKDLEHQLLKKYNKHIDYLGLETDKNPLEQAYFFRNEEIAYNAITKEGDE
ncbi:MAG: DUF488 domain-containing protein [Campylobacterota bacterium]|nr:DUF488 domain-containing protein [Campylobacterota bacterium]